MRYHCSSIISIVPKKRWPFYGKSPNPSYWITTKTTYCQRVKNGQHFRYTLCRRPKVEWVIQMKSMEHPSIMSAATGIHASFELMTWRYSNPARNYIRWCSHTLIFSQRALRVNYKNKTANDRHTKTTENH